MVGIWQARSSFIRLCCGEAFLELIVYSAVFLAFPAVLTQVRCVSSFFAGSLGQLTRSAGGSVSVAILDISSYVSNFGDLIETVVM
jgi:hypothetical protein